MAKIIGTRMRYVGRRHIWATGQEVLIVSVHRNDGRGGLFLLRDDFIIGELRPNDVVEFRPFVQAEDGTEGPSWVTSEASPEELTGL